MILLYDNDEKIAPAAATTLVQRGYDNIFMLSGGGHSVVVFIILSLCLTVSRSEKTPYKLLMLFYMVEGSTWL